MCSPNGVARHQVQRQPADQPAQQPVLHPPHQAPDRHQHQHQIDAPAAEGIQAIAKRRLGERRQDQDGPVDQECHSVGGRCWVLGDGGRRARAGNPQNPTPVTHHLVSAVESSTYSRSSRFMSADGSMTASCRTSTSLRRIWVIWPIDQPLRHQPAEV